MDLHQDVPSTSPIQLTEALLDKHETAKPLTPDLREADRIRANTGHLGTTFGIEFDSELRMDHGLLRSWGELPPGPTQDGRCLMLSSIQVNRGLPLTLAIPLALAMFFVAAPLSAEAPAPPTGSICWSCVNGCGGGWICDGRGGGIFGSNDCDVGDGPVGDRCHCFPSGGVCEIQTTQAPEETRAMEERALAVLATGGTLPADGLFYYASRGDQLVLRRKCDGNLVGRVAVAEIGSRPVSAGG